MDMKEMDKKKALKLVKKHLEEMRDFILDRYGESLKLNKETNSKLKHALSILSADTQGGLMDKLKDIIMKKYNVTIHYNTDGTWDIGIIDDKGELGELIIGKTLEEAVRRAVE